jgi:predicted chitinase
MNFHYGIVENRADPLELGRCQVRIVGLHTHDKTQLPTADLPWAVPLQPVISAAMNGIGHSPVGPVEGTSVIIMFADTDYQQPIILGTVGGIPSKPGSIDNDDFSPINITNKIEDIELRTVPGPTTGNVLKFYDPKTGSTNLTSKLKANMKVIGFNIPKETTIVSIRSSTEIVISTVVTNYGENIITFDSAPTNLDSLKQAQTQNYLTDSSGNVVVDGSGQPITSGSTGNSVKSSPTNNSIPTIPPEKSSPNNVKSSQGIKALIAACDKVGLTTKEQKCALLGIAGGESRWIPQQEAFNYGEKRLKQVYSFATETDVQQYSNASKKGVSRQQFFSWAYGPSTRGKGFLGNKTDDDGGKYYGRGFIQLTGRANYERYQKLANELGLTLDIVNNPDSLDNDINISALVAALYFKDRVKGVSPNDHPGYFLAAKKAVGNNTPDISALKQSYYEYFYGKEDAGGFIKDAGPPVAEPPSEEETDKPGPSKKSIETGSSTIGFRDPNGKYPLEEYIGESDTNRLARGVIEGTVVKLKDASRVRSVQKSLRQGTWDQPEAPYGAKYPFNKVFESESGHVMEFDDTPGQERIHTYHRSGTFQEIDPNGTVVNYIVGDNFVLMERNGCINVKGECNITVDGNTNIYARTDANIQVQQNATVEVGNNLTIGVATDTTLAVGGDLKIRAVGDISIDGANIYTKSQGVLETQSLGAMNIKAASINQEAEGAANYLSGGETRIDYSLGHFGAGAASAKNVDNVELTPPELAIGISPIVPYLIAPEREFEEKTIAETPEDYDTPEGRYSSDRESRKTGVIGAPPPVADEETTKLSGGSSKIIPVDCKIVYATKEFTNDFRLSKNFTLGMLIDGGVNGRHRLADQMLREGNEERIFTAQEIVCNLSQLSSNILEPMLDVLPGGIGGYKTQWKINSGYRLRGVIKNESPVSEHCKGRAVDIGILLPNKEEKTYEIIQKAEKLIPYDQLILEYRYPDSVWIHVSYNPTSLRRMAFTMVNDKTFKRNSNGSPEGIVLVTNIPPKSA